MKMAEGVDPESAIVGGSESQIRGGSKKDGGDVSPLEALGHRYAMDRKIKQVSIVSDKHFIDLDD